MQLRFTSCYLHTRFPSKVRMHVSLSVNLKPAFHTRNPEHTEDSPTGAYTLAEESTFHNNYFLCLTATLRLQLITVWRSSL